MKTIVFVLVLVSAVMAQDIQLFNENNNLFTERLTNEVIKQHQGQSVVLSAFSVLPPLAQMALASEGPPHDELLRVVGLNDNNLVKSVYPAVNKMVSSIKGVELKLASKIYIGKKEKLNQTFTAVSEQLFGSEIQNIDFDNKEAAAQEINHWVENKTNNRIKNLVDAASLTRDSRAILVNAVYFKGNWVYKFDERQTKPQDFFSTKTGGVLTLQVPTMHLRKYFNYAFSKELGATVLELPYKGGENSLLLVIPQEINGLPSLLNKLNNNPSLLHQVSLEQKDVNLHLPKFKIETTTDLKQALQNVGVKELFVPTKGNLKNFLLSDDLLFIGDARQKAFIEVNEVGTEAAAANEFQVLAGSAMIPVEPVLVRADHPFYFQVKTYNTTLFTGIVQF